MLKVVVGVLGEEGEEGAVTSGGLVREVRLEALREEEALLRSTEVLIVWREWGRWKGLELVSDTVAVAEEADQARRLRGLGGEMGSWVGVWDSWDVEGSGEAVRRGWLAWSCEHHYDCDKT